jgi:hypothetical protein
MDIGIYIKYIFIDFIVEVLLFSLLVYFVVDVTEHHMSRISSISDALRLSDDLTIYYTGIVYLLLMYRNLYEFAICPYERNRAWSNSKGIWTLIVLRTMVINVFYVSVLLIASITNERNPRMHTELTIVILTCYVSYEALCIVIRIWYCTKITGRLRILYMLGLVSEVLLLVGTLVCNLCFINVICEDKPNKNISEYVLYFTFVLSSVYKLMDLVPLKWPLWSQLSIVHTQLSPIGYE